MNQRIKEIRGIENLTQQEFAKKIGTSQNVLANWESGRRNPSASAINNICKTFGINEEWLRYGTGERCVSDSQDELNALSKKYGLSSSDMTLIEKYVSLKPDSRKAVMDFITDVVSALNVQTAAEVSEQKIEPNAASDLDIDSEVEAYRRTLELQKKVVEKSSASYGTGESTVNNKIG